MGCPYENEPDSETDSGGREVDQDGAQYAACWRAAVCEYLCRAVFYHEFDLGQEGLLYVWVFVFVLWDYGKCPIRGLKVIGAWEVN